MFQLYEALQAERDLLRAVCASAPRRCASAGRLANLVSLSADWIWEQDTELRFTYFSEGFRVATGIDPAELIGGQRGEQPVRRRPELLAEHTAQIENHEPSATSATATAGRTASSAISRISGEPIFDAGSASRATAASVPTDQATLAAARAAARELRQPDRPAQPQPVRCRARAHARPCAAHRHQLRHCASSTWTASRASTTPLATPLATSCCSRWRSACAAAARATSSPASAATVRRPARRPGRRRRDLRGRAQAARHHRRTAAAGRPQCLDHRQLRHRDVPADGGDAQTLLKNADAAMYQAKALGKNNFQFYTAALSPRSRRCCSRFGFRPAPRHRAATSWCCTTSQVRHRHRHDARRRGAGALAASTARPRPSRRVHPDRRGQRRLIVPLGAGCSTGLPADRPVAGRRLDVPARDQLGAPVHQRLADRRHLDALAGGGISRRIARGRDHRRRSLMADPRPARLATLQRLHALGCTSRSTTSAPATRRSRTSSASRRRRSDRLHSFVSGLPLDRDDAAITARAVIALSRLGMQVRGRCRDAGPARLPATGLRRGQGYLTGRYMPGPARRQAAPAAPLTQTAWCAAFQQAARPASLKALRWCCRSARCRWCNDARYSTGRVTDLAGPRLRIDATSPRRASLTANS